ncbi:MAG: hypothetical protein EOM64_04960 [Erysipelotrichia bacterium]|nr:hypothetical protein [Erysipelotrichia bacterium]
MKKTAMILASLLALASLTGCTDASAKLKDSSTVLMTVGKTKITKGELFSTMNSSAGETTAITNATKVIAGIEVPITDDIKSNAESTLNSYISMYGDTFSTYLESSGMTKEEYMNNYLIPSLQSAKLTDKYIETEWDSLMVSYDPVKVTILTFSSEDDANSALSALNDGSKDISTVIADYSSSSTGNPEIVTLSTTTYDSTVLSVARSGSTDDGWTLVPSTSTVGSFYLIRIENNDPSTMTEDVTAALDQLDSVKNDATTYFFRKYNFHVYDIELYNSIKNNNPECLIQAMPAPTSTPTASATASAAATASASAAAK